MVPVPERVSDVIPTAKVGTIPVETPAGAPTVDAESNQVMGSNGGETTVGPPVLMRTKGAGRVVSRSVGRAPVAPGTATVQRFHSMRLPCHAAGRGELRELSGVPEALDVLQIGVRP